MGSSSSNLQFYWVLNSTLCGILFLIFDATRHFVHQLSPVSLRRLSADADGNDRRGGWLLYDPDNFQLVSGALLQIALIGAVASTVMALSNRPLLRATATAGLIWIAFVLVWKFILALIPDEAAEIALRGVIPISYFFFYLFWPVLYPLRRLVARLDRQDEEASVGEEPTEEAVQAFIDVGEEEGILEGPEGK